MTADPVGATPSWFVAPGETDTLAWVAIALLAAAVFLLVTLYAAFDRWAEHRAKGTPLARTIPTLLTIALIYEVFPVAHFSLLLPLCAILVALMADWSRFHAVVGFGPAPAASGAGLGTGTGTGSDMAARSPQPHHAACNPEV